jgi:simple sugar transport system ATP-binding protein
MSATREILRVENVGKSYGPVVALRDVNLSVREGETLGLIGDNGAGKSTLIKILSGYLAHDKGRVFVRGEEQHLQSVTHARSLGIDAVHQDLALVAELPVYQNLFLRRELQRRIGPLRILDRTEMRRRAREYLDEIGVRIASVDTEVGLLSGGQRQAIAISRSVHSEAKVLLLDEPLAAMGAREGRLIIDLIRRLKARGDVAIILIAHNYMNVMDVCDRINLLRHGSIVFDRPASSTSFEELMNLVASEYWDDDNAAGSIASAPS